MKEPQIQQRQSSNDTHKHKPRSKRPSLQNSPLLQKRLSPRAQWHLDLWGWILFTVSALLYSIASARIQDWMNFSASFTFLIADLLFLISFLLGSPSSPTIASTTTDSSNVKHAWAAPPPQHPPQNCAENEQLVEETTEES